MGRPMYGFPLNIPYMNEDQIWQEVKNTGIHALVNDDLTYVLSVGIYPYPNYVLSVWVYIAVIYNM